MHSHRVLRLLLVTLVALPAVAAPRDFPFTWNTKTLGAHTDGMESWLTPRLERTVDFAQLDLRAAWVHGVTDSVESQLSLDVDLTHTNADQNINPRLSSLWRWAAFRSEYFSFAGNGRVSLGTRMFEAEARLVADVEVGRLLFSFNVSGARAVLWDGLTGADTRLEGNLGARFQFASFASLGLEARSKTSWQKAAYVGTALYVGPALTLRFDHFWATIGLQAQVVGDKGKDDPSTDPQELRDNERFVLRLALGAN